MGRTLEIKSQVYHFLSAVSFGSHLQNKNKLLQFRQCRTTTRVTATYMKGAQCRGVVDAAKMLVLTIQVLGAPTHVLLALTLAGQAGLAFNCQLLHPYREVFLLPGSPPGKG